jgi:LmbE family N-acetylglucosaminyl deacetylase
MRVLVVGAHPDDEVFGCGGTIPKFTRQGFEVHVLTLTRGDGLFDEEFIEQGRREALKAHRILGVAETHFENLPTVRLDTIPQYQINDLLLTYFQRIKPNVLFLPFYGDINRDHQIVHACGMVAARPTGSTELRAIYSYEALSSTNWNSPGLTPTFIPNTFSDITDTLDLKIEAVKAFASQLKPYPHERSVESVIALSRYRGGFVNKMYAEAFVCLRQMLS